MHPWPLSHSLSGKTSPLDSGGPFRCLHPTCSLPQEAQLGCPRDVHVNLMGCQGFFILLLDTHCFSNQGLWLPKGISFH
jgi:hypothetical protein